MSVRSSRPIWAGPVPAGRKIGEMVDEVQAGPAMSGAIAQRARSIYGRHLEGVAPKDYDEENLLRLGSQLSKGVPIATPVFDGAHEPDIVESAREGWTSTAAVR